MKTNITKTKKIKLSIITGALMTLIICGIFSVTGFSKECDEVRNDVLRLHILANSDSPEDQKIKLLVRDKLLESGAEVFNGSVNAENAIEKIMPETEKLEQAAKQILSENGFDYDVDVTVQKEYFNTRSYDNLTMPAGEYMAVRVLLGEAKGKNWWCVMFPPLCLPAAEKNSEADMDVYFNNGETQVIESNPRYEPRFKIVEVFEKLKDRFS